MTRFTDDAPTHIYLKRRGYMYYLLGDALGWKMDKSVAGVWTHTKAKEVAKVVIARMQSRMVLNDEIGLTYANDKIPVQGSGQPVTLEGRPK